MTKWKADPTAGPWIVVTATGGDHFMDDLVFETREDAQQWADEFNQAVEYQPMRLHVRRLGWLRPSVLDSTV